MNRVFWVVHGESQDRVRGELACRWNDRSLTDRGLVQARQTADHLHRQGVSVLYSSPLKRAIETAEVFRIRMGLPIIPVESFRSINVGELERQGIERRSQEIYQRVRRSWQEGDKSARFPGGEDLYMLMGRFQDGLNHLAHRNPGASIIVVGHADQLAATLPHLGLGAELPALAGRPLPSCSISELALDVQQGRLTVQVNQWAAVDHLSGDAARFHAAWYD